MRRLPMMTGASRHGSRAQQAAGLGEVMSSVARDLQEEHGDVEATLRGILKAAAQTTPGAEECGVTYVVGRDQLESRAGTSALPKKVDALQCRLQEGPCIDAVWKNKVVRVDDVAGEGRWPRFTRDASGLGVVSMLCFQLFAEGSSFGALSLYGRVPNAFDDESEGIGLVFAGHAAVALVGAQHEDNLRTGMAHRDVIGQAKGILMERHKLTADLAFAALVRASSVTNRKLLDIVPPRV